HPSARSNTGIRSPGANHAADKHGWIEAGLNHHPAGHGRGRGLSVRTGDGNRPIALHERGEHIGPAEYGQTFFARSLKLRICIFDRGRNNHSGCAFEILSALPNKDLDAFAREAAKICSVFLVAALYSKATRGHNLGDGAHADAANANNMYATAGKRVFHRRVLSLLPPLAL